MKVCTLKDFNLVYSFFERPDRVGDITDDNSPSMLNVVKHLLKTGLACMPTDNTLFAFTPINSILWEAHLNTTEEEKHDVYKNTLIMATWLAENTVAQTLLSFIPEIYPATMYYAKKIGMKQVGVIKNGFVKDGKLEDNIIMSASVSKIQEVLSWQQQQ